MRMSCNGCRVLRKGCSENCSIRPCLQWIKNPDSQGNATVFLAKFYGRAGLMNLINAGAEPFRPAIFRSLLYEACGRIVNPIYGSVGLMYSGSWELCQAAVEAVLKGAPIVQIPSETAASSPVPSLKAYDIRHVAKEEPCAAASGAAVRDLHKVSKTTRPRFKRSAANNSGGVGEPKQKASSADAAQIDLDESAQVCNLRWRRCYPIGFQRAPSHESFGSQVSGPATVATGAGDGESRESESLFSGDTAEGSMVTSHAEPGNNDGSAEDSGEVDLDLTLGLEPLGHAATSRAVPHPVTDHPKQCNTTTTAWRMDTCTADLGLDLAA